MVKSVLDEGNVSGLNVSASVSLLRASSSSPPERNSRILLSNSSSLINF